MSATIELNFFLKPETSYNENQNLKLTLQKYSPKSRENWHATK